MNTSNDVGFYGYRDNAYGAPQMELENLRRRVNDVENRTATIHAWRRIAAISFFTMLVMSTLSAVVARTSGTRNYNDSCRDTIVEANAGVQTLSCPHPDQKMQTETIVMPSAKSDVWAVRCVCKR
jgi:hypothetical protein